MHALRLEHLHAKPLVRQALQMYVPLSVSFSRSQTFCGIVRCIEMNIMLLTAWHGLQSLSRRSDFACRTARAMVPRDLHCSLAAAALSDSIEAMHMLQHSL